MPFFKSFILVILGPAIAMAKAPRPLPPSALKQCQAIVDEMNDLPQEFRKSACSYYSEGDFVFNLLSKEKSPGCNHTIVIVGEDHLYAESKRTRTFEMLKSFKFKGLENAWDGHRLKNSGETQNKQVERENLKNPSLRSGPLTVLVSYMMWALYGDFGSSVLDMRNTGLYIFENGFLVNGRDYNLELKMQTIPEKFFEIFSPMLGRPDFPPVGFSIEFGDAESYDYDCSNFNSKDCMGFVQTERNHRMAKNIDTILEYLPCGTPLAVGVGAAHVGPLSKGMTEKRNFKLVSPELSKNSYPRIGNDPEYPEE